MINLALRSIFVHASKVSITCRKILRCGVDGFAYPPREIVLLIFIALKNLSPSAGFKPANLGSNGKNVNHFITDDEIICVTV
jgi:hypothetical protein